MLYTIAVVLILLWLLGMVSSYTIGGFIHFLLVIAIISVLLRVIGGRKPVLRTPGSRQELRRWSGFSPCPGAQLRSWFLRA
jgi:hypothetical protein